MRSFKVKLEMGEDGEREREREETPFFLFLPIHLDEKSSVYSTMRRSLFSGDHGKVD